MMAEIRLCLALAVVWACLGISSTQAGGDARPTVSWRQDRLSVDSDGAPLAQVLLEIARQTGLRVSGADSLKRHTSTSARFSGLPLPKALAQLLTGVNFAIVEGPCAGAGGCPMTLVVLDNQSAQAVRRDQAGAALVAQQPPGTTEADRRLDQVYEAAQAGDLEVLKQAAANKNNDATHSMALDLLVQKDPGAAADLALTAAASSDLGDRVTGLRALAHIESPAAVRALGKALNDSDRGVQETALFGLAEQRGPEAARLMRQAAEDPDPSIQILAKSLLAARDRQTQVAPAPTVGGEP
jgi:HEAT repeat protein